MQLLILKNSIETTTNLIYCSCTLETESYVIKCVQLKVLCLTNGRNTAQVRYLSVVKDIT